MRWRSLAVMVLVMATAGSARAQTAVSLVGVVVDSVTARPVEGVNVYLVGRKSDVLSRRDGIFRLPTHSPSRALMLLRRIGYVPRAISVEIEGSGPTEVDIGTIRLQPLAVMLSPIVVESTLVARNPRLVDFYRRSRGGAGQYVTREDIWRQNPILTTDLLRRIPGIEVRCSSELEGCRPTTARARGLAGSVCPMRVILDGMPTSMTLDDIPPAWIAGIEIYKGSAFTPAEFGSSYCGTVVLWTGADLYH